MFIEVSNWDGKARVMVRVDDIRAVAPNDQGGASIYFGKDDRIETTDSYEDVVRLIESAGVVVSIKGIEGEEHEGYVTENPPGAYDDFINANPQYKVLHK